MIQFSKSVSYSVDFSVDLPSESIRKVQVRKKFFDMYNLSVAQSIMKYIPRIILVAYFLNQRLMICFSNLKKSSTYLKTGTFESAEVKMRKWKRGIVEKIFVLCMVCVTAYTLRDL